MDINIVSRGFKGSWLIIGLPDAGLVGAISTAHIVKVLSLETIGYVDSELLPPIVVVHQSKVYDPVRFFGREGLMILSSEVPIHHSLVYPLSRAVVEWALREDVRGIIVITGIAVPNRIEIETPEVYAIAGSPEARELVEKGGIKSFEEGFVVGPAAAVMKECIRKRMPSLMLLAQCFLEYPDPGAAAQAILALNRVLNINIDVKPLLDEAEMIRVKTRELMRRTTDVLRQMRKSHEYEVPLMYT
ncbi:MAG: proteasome assembly chaperone family protein [Candidatus Nezhaarchaeota archaeon]|nr:proteasome assembly chaperone family protein [Candidatus Nezhaarchaeota archaeon]MCX8142257.1 proteasome assembly chaperone family protein [Candidatus Nezhaarchaeota archaeon]MDW8050770.1 proteasome assembly chaperone family protein [Nitrososphaerota archaeon]